VWTADCLRIASKCPKCINTFGLKVSWPTGLPREVIPRRSDSCKPGQSEWQALLFSLSALTNSA
jgi:hypothetical protein